jgi:hypothetical protein
LLISRYQELRANVTENLTWLVASRRNRALTPRGAAPTASAPEPLLAQGLRPGLRHRGALVILAGAAPFRRKIRALPQKMPHLLRQAHESRT